MTYFPGSKVFGCFEKHLKVVSGALRGGFRAREVFGSFEKRTPGLEGAGSDLDDSGAGTLGGFHGGAGTAGQSIFSCSGRRHGCLYKLLEVSALEPLTKDIYQ